MKTPKIIASILAFLSFAFGLALIFGCASGGKSTTNPILLGCQRTFPRFFAIKNLAEHAFV